MPRIPALLAGCVLVGAIACGTAWTWLHLTGTRSLTAGAVIVCTLASVAIGLLVEAAVKQVRRQRLASARHRKSVS